MEVLRFVEARFRMGFASRRRDGCVLHDDAVPAYAAEKVTPPAEAAIATAFRKFCCSSSEQAAG